MFYKRVSFVRYTILIAINIRFLKKIDLLFTFFSCLYFSNFYHDYFIVLNKNAVFIDQVFLFLFYDYHSEESVDSHALIKFLWLGNAYEENFQSSIHKQVDFKLERVNCPDESFSPCKNTSIVGLISTMNLLSFRNNLFIYV